MAYFYTYIDPTQEEARFAQKEPEEKERRKSVEMKRKDSVKNRKEDRKGSDSSSDEEEVKQTKI